MRTAILSMLLTLVALAGCTPSTPPEDALHYYNSGRVPEVRRVVFVELVDDSSYPDVAERMSHALQESLLRQGMFRVDLIPCTAPDIRDLDMDKREAYTVAELQQIRDELRCDAVLFGKVVSFRPYPNTQIGLFLRLLDVKNGQVVWAMDEIWDTKDLSTVRRIKDYRFDQQADEYERVDDDITRMSLAGFQGFVAHEVVQTMLPPERRASRDQGFLQKRWVRKVGRESGDFARDVKDDL